MVGHRVVRHKVVGIKDSSKAVVSESDLGRQYALTWCSGHYVANPVDLIKMTTKHYEGQRSPLNT